MNILENFRMLDVARYHGAYDPRLVALSVGIAMLSAYAALAVADHIAGVSRRSSRRIWIGLGAVMMGAGIWAMHFIGMLAFTLPCGVHYHLGLTLASILPGVIGSGVAMHAMGRPDLSRSQLWTGALFMGGGIGAMHYAGMAGMEPDALLRYDPRIVLLSLAVAVVLARLALAVRAHVAASSRFSRRWIPVLVIGLAISGMHYVAMEAAVFYPARGFEIGGALYSPQSLALVIAGVAGLTALATLGALALVRLYELTAALREEIARREQSERETLNERGRLQAVFDAVVDAIVTIDARGRILQWSKGAEKIFGYLPAEVIGLNVAMLMPRQHGERHSHYVGNYLSTSNAKIIGIGRELTAVRRNGEEFPMELAVSEVRVGGEIFFCGIMRDITERKRIEADLVRAREEAEAANAAKSQFLATMSHEIRTPLNGVIGLAGLLSTTPLNSRQARLVANLSRSGQALLAIINDILDFSKIEAGRLELFEVDFDPREVVADVADLFSERCTTKGLELIYFVANDVPRRVAGDPVRVRQILVNLVSNAFKFTERGEILVELDVAGTDDKSVLLAFAVEDTGVGIPPEKKSRMFESFRQVDGSMIRRRDGTGLGLAISRQLVELMGGRIGVDSERGRGSRFHFTIRCPRIEGMAAEEQKFERPMRVLVAEANAVSAHVLSMYFAYWGIDPVFVSLVEEAEREWLAAAGQGRPFDVVVLDIKGMAEGGIELGRRIRTESRSGVVFLLGMDRFVADTSIETIPGAGIITKPVRPSELFDCLSAIASGSQNRDTTAFYVRRNGRAGKPRFDARLLVAEDNPVNQDVAIGILENMGCRVVTAPNGAVAARLMAQEQFDMVLMDCEMPELDGFGATRRIRQLQAMTAGLEGSQRRTPIVALTAHALADIRQKCIDAGMDDFLVKPFDESQMIEALRRWIGHLERAPVEGGRIMPAHGESALAAGKAREDSPIDLTQLGNVSAFKGPNGGALFRRVVGRFADSAPRLAASLRDKHGAGETEELWRIAHSLKSSAAALGAGRLSRRCAEIEELAKEGRGDALRPLLDDLEAELASALKTLAIMTGDKDERVA